MKDLIIAALLWDEPKYGYQLKKQAGAALGKGELHNNVVYPLLRELMNRRWVQRRSAPGERGQTRLIYSLTAAGRGGLVKRLAQFNDKDARSEEAFRLRAGLFEVLDRETRTRILGARRNFLEGRAERLSRIEKSVDAGSYPGEVVNFLQQQTRAEIRWIRKLAKRVTPRSARGRA